MQLKSRSNRKITDKRNSDTAQYRSSQIVKTTSRGKIIR